MALAGAQGYDDYIPKRLQIHHIFFASILDPIIGHRSWEEQAAIIKGVEKKLRGTKLYNNIGECKQSLGDQQAALYNFTKAVEIKPDLVIALRPDVQPGETLDLKIVREGKEESQGVGYLDDGTMVVIENAREMIGERLSIIVTGALQTPTGRMIFGKLKKQPTST